MPLTDYPPEVRATLLAMCEKKDLPTTGTTTMLKNRLQKKIAKAHKKKGTLGRTPNVLTGVLKKVCKKKKLAQTGSIEMLMARVKNATEKVKKPNDSNILNKGIPDNMAAEDVKKLLKVPVGTKCCFKSGAKKVLTEQTTGGYRWKNIA
tara:strand:+ start:843 stop:1289 length:447 start_codon:yes stop_codon:yes gene_type:complete